MGRSEAGRASDQAWSLDSVAQWEEATALADRTVIEQGGLVLKGTGEGHWISKWRSVQAPARSVEITLETDINLFDNKTIEVLVKGSDKPYNGTDQVPHDWYGRCMIAIIDENRWIMALRSGLDHINWQQGDAIHLISSTDEGRTWGALNRWFDGRLIAGMPYDDGHTHSEPGLYRLPNGDLILQFWRTGYSSGTKQLRSTDNGKTWTLDIDRVCVAGVPGAEDDWVIGTEDYFVDPHELCDIYMAFQYLHYPRKFGKAGTLLARSTDNCKSYTFVSWIGPLVDEKDSDGGATFEPAVEYVGNGTIVAVLRDAAGNRRTWQSISTDMGATFSPLVDISAQVNGGVPAGLWQRARLYKESNPCFQYGNRLDYSKGEGRLWGFGLHSIGGGYTRKPVVYWSDDNAQSWNGPELLHGPMHPGTDTGYGDLKRRVDNTYVAATYYGNQDSTEADVEQYTFGGKRAKVRVEVDHDEDGSAEGGSAWHELYNGPNTISLSAPAARRWRLKLLLTANDAAQAPKIRRVQLKA